MAERNLNILSLDGGGVRGISTLYILKEIMASVTADPSPKPCDYFDMIGGTGSGG
jgi:patatin-like phospholipase/acyl hydrolase